MMRGVPTRTVAGTVALGGLVSLGTAPASAQDAELELYGNFRYSANWAQDDGGSHWTGANNASRAGLRGALEREEWEAFYHLEAGAHVDAQGAAFSPRFYFGGVRGPMGSVTVGRHSPEYKMPALQVDPFYDTSTLNVGANIPVSGVFAGASYGLSSLGNGWANRTVLYRTPEYEGFTGSAAVYLDPDGQHDYAGGVTFAADGLEAGFRVHENRSAGGNWTAASGVERAFRGHLLLGDGDWSAGLTLERVELLQDASQNLAFASATLRPLERGRISLAVGRVGSAPGLSLPEGLGIHAGGFYELMEDAEVFALFSTASLDDGDDSHAASLGLTVDFGWSP